MTTHACPLCSSQYTSLFVRRQAVPVHQNLVVPSQPAARNVAKADLEFAVCEDCGFVFNQAFDLARLSYGEHYDGSQCYSPAYNARLDEQVCDMVERHGVRNSVIVEVGCGRGRFIHKLVSVPGANNTGFGFDPSYVGPDSELDGQLQFRRSYYDQRCTDVAADVVVCRHVIEHVPEPLSLLQSVRAALGRSRNARVFFETPCVDWILRNRVVWDFFYEHCSLFSADTLSAAFQRTGFTVNRVEHIFGGQYLWLEAQTTNKKIAPPPKSPSTAALARAYAASEVALRAAWQSKLQALNARGKVALWGAGAKAATFANLADRDGTRIDCVTDVNPNKQGHFLPGTGHAIVAPAYLPARGVRFAVLMNANYRDEIQQMLLDGRIDVELIDWSE